MALLMAVQGLFALILINPVGMYVMRRLVEWRTLGLLRSRLVAFGAFSLLAAAVAAAVAVVVHATIGVGIAVAPAWLAALTIGYLTAHTAFAHLSLGLNVFNRRQWYVGLSVAAAWIGLVGSILLAVAVAPVAESWLAGQLAVEAALALLAWFALERLGYLMGWRGAAPNSGAVVERIGRVAGFGWPVAVGVGLYWLQTQGYSFVVVRGLGTELLGAMTVSLGLGARILSAYERLFQDLFLPTFYTEVATDRRAAWDRYARLLLPSLLVVAIFAVAAGPWLVRLLTAPAYHALAWLAAWGAVVEALRVAFGGFTLAFHGHLRTGPLVFPSLAAAATVVLGVLVAVTAAPDPVLGVAVSLAAGGVVTVGLSTGLARGLLRVQLPLRDLALAIVAMLPLVVLYALAGVVADQGSRTVAFGLLTVGSLYTLAVVASSMRSRAPVGWTAKVWPRWLE